MSDIYDLAILGGWPGRDHGGDLCVQGQVKYHMDR